MRRQARTVSVAVLCVMLFPAPARANIWSWLDKLSGPRFAGWSVHWRVVCFKKDDLEALLQLARDTGARAQLAERAAPEAHRLARTRAADAAARAAWLAELIIRERPPRTKAAVDAVVNATLTWLRVSASYSMVAEGRAELKKVDELRQDAEKTERDALQRWEQSTLAVVPGFAVIFSACDFTHRERRRGSIDINFASGRDTEDSANKLVMFGPSFSWEAVRSLEAGIGGGVAWFSSTNYDSFAKVYLEPIRIDWRPFVLLPSGNREARWRHIILARYAMLTFPQGFAENAFGTSPRYGAELVHRIMVSIDLEPFTTRR